METLIKRLERSTLVQAGIYLVIGLLILFNPRFFFDVIVYLVAGYFAVLGLWVLFQGLRQRKDGLPPSFFMGIVYILIALIVFFFAETLASLLPLFIGFLFLFGGLIRLIQAVGFRKTIANRWMFFLLSSLLWIGIGLLMLANPFDSLLVLFQLFGGFLIAVGLIELVLYFTLRSARRQHV
ncbi:hypothetical protein EVJ24_11110 [Exiguobacterium sp. SH1S21]|uniref:HdeD family acid-resistance protein n=1 Tax=unclassified Exiguobacterium TaxID=2644629 RepID=UPI00103E4E1E|nr:MULTISPECIES: DUF308 domain-containing protein [unclassified Exiguobacterium]TCI53067.1 hypothetical protein EVJ24_11110 [Exiguobacterium sp. SH1S21]TCI68479.1 hypothetical protein EVJ22_12305 [Exiguobacterium sp. SH0S7]